MKSVVFKEQVSRWVLLSVENNEDYTTAYVEYLTAYN